MMSNILLMFKGKLSSCYAPFKCTSIIFFLSVSGDCRKLPSCFDWKAPTKHSTLETASLR